MDIQEIICELESLRVNCPLDTRAEITPLFDELIKILIDFERVWNES